MVFTLHKYIFRELLRVFALACVALTLILSLGSVLRPVQEYGAGPAQVLRLLGYFLPITLTFVLPIASLFAAALIYGRFAHDNELEACKASGISLANLIYPSLSFSIIIAIATLILSFHVVPAYVQRAEKAIKADAKQILFRNIERKGYYNMPGGKYRIYADVARVDSDDLLGVVVANVGEHGISSIITAQSAQIHFEPQKRFNQVTVIAHKANQIDADGHQAYSEWLPIAGEFGSLLSDNIKFKKIDDMKKIRNDLMNFYPVAKLAFATYAQLGVELLAEDISQKISDNNDSFYMMHNKDKLLEFNAESCIPRNERTLELSGKVRLFEYDVITQSLICSWQSDRAIIQLENDQDISKLLMVLYDARWERSDGIGGLAQRHIVRGLFLPDNIKDRLGEDVLGAVTAIDSNESVLKRPSQHLIESQKLVQRKIRSTLAAINAELNSRLVFGIGCIPLILIGTALGILLKGGHLLTAFGASSIPAGILIVCIMMGKNITKNASSQGLSGVFLMWSGLVILSVIGVVIYRKLLRT